MWKSTFDDLVNGVTYIYSGDGFVIPKISIVKFYWNVYIFHTSSETWRHNYFTSWLKTYFRLPILTVRNTIDLFVKDF